MQGRIFLKSDPRYAGNNLRITPATQGRIFLIHILKGDLGA